MWEWRDWDCERTRETFFCVGPETDIFMQTREFLCENGELLCENGEIEIVWENERNITSL